MEKREPSYTVGEKMNWYSQYGKQKSNYCIGITSMLNLEEKKKGRERDKEREEKEKRGREEGKKKSWTQKQRIEK